MRISVEGISHRGLVRDHNEDAFGWRGLAVQSDDGPTISVELDVDKPTTIVVCDGMGGHAGGDRAALLATRTVGSDRVVGSSVDHDDMVSRLRAVLQECSDSMGRLVGSGEAGRPPGCTVVGVTVFSDGSALVFNVGDSRAYTLDDGILSRLTVDHRRDGSNALIQALGGGGRTELAPSFHAIQLGPEPGVVLCTDGLDDYADAGAVETVMSEETPNLPLRLRNLALTGGGGDNVTVVQLRAVHECAENERGAAERTHTTLHGVPQPPTHEATRPTVDHELEVDDV